MSITRHTLFTWLLLFFFSRAVTAGQTSCDGKAADNFVSEINKFNDLLVDYASMARSDQGLRPRAISSKSSNKNLKVTSKGYDSPSNAIRPSSVGAANRLNSPRPSIKAQTTTRAAAVVSAKPAKLSPIQERFNALLKQQDVLDQAKSACIPLSHKPKVLEAFTKLFTTYLVHDKNLKAASKLVTMNEAMPIKQGQAGWLTMNDDVNSGYNGNINELTSSSSEILSTSTTYAFYNPNGGPVSIIPEFVTVTVTQPTAAKSTPSSDSNSSGGGDEEGGDEEGGDSGTDGSGSAGSGSAVTAAAPAPTHTAHHNIIYRTIDGTYHLFTGSLHLIGDVLHIFIPGHSNGAAPAAAPSTGGDADEAGTGELAKLVQQVAKLYQPH